MEEVRPFPCALGKPVFIKQRSSDTILKSPFIDDRQKTFSKNAEWAKEFVITLFLQTEVHVRRVLMCWEHSTLFLHN